MLTCRFAVTSGQWTGCHRLDRGSCPESVWMGPWLWLMAMLAAPLSVSAPSSRGRWAPRILGDIWRWGITVTTGGKGARGRGCAGGMWARGGRGVLLGGSRDAVQPPARHRAAPRAKNYPVSGAEAEKPCGCGSALCPCSGP